MAKEHKTKKEVFEYLDYLIQDIEDLPEKAWLKPAMAAYLKRWAKTMDDKDAVTHVDAWWKAMCSRCTKEAPNAPSNSLKGQ